MFLRLQSEPVRIDTTYMHHQTTLVLQRKQNHRTEAKNT